MVNVVANWKPTEIPCGFERAILNLDDMNRRDNYSPCCVFVCGDGRPTIKRFNVDGTTSTITFIGGEWFEGVKLQ